MNNKIVRCLCGRSRNFQRLRTFISGIVNAPTDACSEFCERAAYRELRHMIRYTKLLRYYHRGGNQ